MRRDTYTFDCGGKLLDIALYNGYTTPEMVSGLVSIIAGLGYFVKKQFLQCAVANSLLQSLVVYNITCRVEK